jgi:membrane-associated protein
MTLIDLFHSLTDPDKLIQLLSTVLTGWAGYLVLFAVVFAESGLLIGFFLPGDSLLFTVGVVSGAGKLPVGTMITMLAIASMLGDGIGFLLGSSLGFRLFSNPKSRIFRREYLDRTHAFNVVGAVGWVASMITLGYMLGNIPVIRQNFEKVVLAIIFISLIPALMQILKGRKDKTIVPPLPGAAGE